MTAAAHPLRVVSRKWPDRPHWEFDAVRLGEDEHGVWVGAPVGTLVHRPGARFVTDQAQVTLVPRDAPFLATFYAPGGRSPCAVYVDITTVPVWSKGPACVVTAVDLDLDVVRGWTGRVWVDDEDEFAAHRVRLGYPADVVRLASSACEAVRVAVSSGRPPYDGSAVGWLAALQATTSSTGRAPGQRVEGEAMSEQADRTAVDVRVHGEVQGVFFRDSCRTEAQAAGVHGWVSNQYDGSVRAHLEGSADAVEKVVSWMRHGPRQARVQHVDVEPAEPDGRTGFEVR